ncbi:MAG: endonuclease III [Bacteroidaceae bacterium]|nr:endonuclease III [Bacteroidaceae bacterium]MBR6128626.1 endonuclease III [Bacteroidaceae bacterium]
MTRKQLYREVATYFRQAMPEAKTELHYDNPFQLLVAVILSAQCTDKRINQVTPRLFEDYPTAEAMALATPEVIYSYISSVSYPNNKAKHLVDMARMLWEKYQGEVPQDLKQLTELPGVGRKTANVVLSVVWGEARMAVDTHVFRVSHRLGLVPDSCKTPLSVEQMLTKHFTEEEIPDAHHWLILHGRYTCTALRPKCDKCGLSHLCKAYRKIFSVKSFARKE